MEKIKIWFVSGLIVIFSLVGLVYFRGRLPSVPEDKNQTEESKTVSKGFAKPEELTLQAKAKNDSEAMTQALKSGSLSDCEKINSDETLKKECEDSINYASILKSQDSTACDQLSDESLKTQCYNHIYSSRAVDEKNISLCEKISDPTMKQLCLDQVQMILGRYAKTAQDCSVISSKTLRSQCEDNFLLQNSTKSLKAEGCSHISNANLLEQCKKVVAKNIEVIQQSKKAAENATVTKTLDEILSLCDTLTGGRATVCKDAVYPQLAFDKKDLTHCDKISDSAKADECRREQGDKINQYYMRQSLALHDKNMCGQISDNDLKKLCQNS